MSDIYYGFESSSYSFDGLRVNAAKPKTGFKVKFLKLLIFIVILVLVLQFTFYFIVLPMTSTAKFIFSVNGTLTEAELKMIAGLGENLRWSKLNSSKISKKLASYPLIKSASVIKRFPDKVYIEIAEREAVALALTAVNGKTVPMEIDREGVVFRMGKVSNTPLVIVSGLKFQNPKAGMRINYLLRALFVQIDTLMKKQPLLLSAVSEIQIAQRKYGGYDLVVYPVNSKVKVIIGNILNEETLRYVMLLSDVVRNGNHAEYLEAVDARGTNAVYIYKKDYAKESYNE